MKTSIVCWSSLAILSVLIAGCVGAAEPGDLEGNNEASYQPERSSEQAVTGSDVESPAAAQTDAPGVRAQPSSAVYCSGFSGSGSACQVRCSNGTWYTVGYNPGISNGNCTEVGNGFCQAYGMWGIGHCWN